MCAPPIGSELELVSEAVATSTSVIIYLGPHMFAGRVFRVRNRGQVLIFEVEQHVRGN